MRFWLGRAATSAIGGSSRVVPQLLRHGGLDRVSARPLARASSVDAVTVTRAAVASGSFIRERAEPAPAARLARTSDSNASSNAFAPACAIGKDLHARRVPG